MEPGYSPVLEFGHSPALELGYIPALDLGSGPTLVLVYKTYLEYSPALELGRKRTLLPENNFKPEVPHSRKIPQDLAIKTRTSPHRRIRLGLLLS